MKGKARAGAWQARTEDLTVLRQRCGGGRCRTLKQADENLQQGATACVAGRTAEAAFRMTDYEKGIKEATGTLGQYSMAP